MKHLTLFFLISIFSFAQVGIQTDSPKSTLDINGNLRIQNVEAGNEISLSKPLYVSSDGFVVAKSTDEISSAVFYASTTRLVLENSKDKFNNSSAVSPLTFDMKDSDIQANTMGISINDDGKLQIGVTGYYLINSFVNFKVSKDNDNRNLYFVINVQKSSDNGSSWEDITSLRPVNNITIEQQSLSTTLPPSFAKLNSGDLLRISFYKNNFSGNNVSHFSINTAYGIPSYQISITKL